MGYVRTGFLLIALMAIFMAVGFVIGGQTGMFIAFLIALGINLFAYWNSDKMVRRMHGAVEADEGSAPEFFGIIRQLAKNASLPMPRVFVMHNPQPNAFATGRNPDNAAVCATTGLLEMLSKEEVAGVMAHEMAHIKSRDTLIMAVTASIASAISMLANFGLFFGSSRQRSSYGPIITILVALLAPFAAMLVQMGISRSREYEADRLGAEICQRPLWLASALAKIAKAAQRIRNPTAAANPATAHLFIVNPLTGSKFDSLFTTHPDVENRIARLVAYAREWGQLEEPPGGLAVPVAPPTDGPQPWGGGSSSGSGSSRGPWG